MFLDVTKQRRVCLDCLAAASRHCARRTLLGAEKSQLDRVKTFDEPGEGERPGSSVLEQRLELGTERNGLIRLIDHIAILMQIRGTSGDNLVTTAEHPARLI